jgi:hypothetical protein
MIVAYVRQSRIQEGPAIASRLKSRFEPPDIHPPGLSQREGGGNDSKGIRLQAGQEM